MSSNKGKFYIGTSNICLPVRNKQAFPEHFRNSSRLTYYGSLFNSLEVNSSFYRTPMATTVSRWAAEVPEEFRFTFKVSRDITHDKTMSCNPALIEDFMTSINATDKKGALLVQFPGSVQYNFRYLNKLLSCLLAHSKGWDLCLEFRHVSWYRDTLYKLLRSLGVAIVFQDMPKAPTPAIEVWTDFVYLRFHGPSGDYRGGYEFDMLEKQATRIREWLNLGIAVYAYFNNTMGSAVFDALTLQELVTGKVTYH